MENEQNLKKKKKNSGEKKKQEKKALAKCRLPRREITTSHRTHTKSSKQCNNVSIRTTNTWKIKHDNETGLKKTRVIEQIHAKKYTQKTNNNAGLDNASSG
jgi:hypothetical protein